MVDTRRKQASDFYARFLRAGGAIRSRVSRPPAISRYPVVKNYRTMQAASGNERTRSTAEIVSESIAVVTVVPIPRFPPGAFRTRGTPMQAASGSERTRSTAEIVAESTAVVTVLPIPRFPPGAC